MIDMPKTIFSKFVKNYQIKALVDNASPGHVFKIYPLSGSLSGPDVKTAIVPI